jgi:hypothetical protein
MISERLWNAKAGAPRPETNRSRRAPLALVPSVDVEIVDAAVVRARRSRDEEGVEVIPRPGFDETVILIPPPGSRWEMWPAFLERARHWWGAGEQLTLVDPPAAPVRRRREAGEFKDALRSWAAEGVKVPSTVQVSFGKIEATSTSRRGSSTSPVVRGDTYALSATVGRRAIAFALAGAADAGDRWIDEYQHPIVMREGDSVAEVVLLRPLTALKGRMSDRDRAEFQVAMRRWREMDQVVLDLLVNNVIENGYQSNGHAFASYDAILDARGIEKKKKGGYSAGHRPEDREEIHQSVLRLVAMGAGVTRIDAKSRRGRLPPALVVHDYEFDLVTGSATGVEYELGKWIDALALETFPTSPIATLQYDLYREQLEQRLARLFVNLSFAGKDGMVVRRVKDILDEVHLTIDVKKPGRTMERFQKAMDRLKADGVIGRWCYDPEEPFEARGFLHDWLQRDLVITRGTRVALPAG